MIKYKINVYDALQRAGYNVYKLQRQHLISPDTLTKIRNDDTNISLKTINVLCRLLDLQPKDLIYYEKDEEKSVD